MNFIIYLASLHALQNARAVKSGFRSLDRAIFQPHPVPALVSVPVEVEPVSQEDME